MTTVVLCGGVGAARLLRGLLRVTDPAGVCAIVNTGDDMVLHGLHISPDLDTCTYTMAEAINPETGWGLVDETWQARTALERYGGQTWFGLGDRDLATHMYRTQRLSEGAGLAEVTAEITRTWGLATAVVPMTEDSVRTRVTIDTGETLDFQRYFVERGHRDPIGGVEFAGVEQATAAPGVIEAIAAAHRIIVAPSNPIVSIAPILAVPGVRAALAERRDSCVGVSPIVGGQAVKGPAADMLAALGHTASASGVARLYRDVVSGWIIDQVDADQADLVAELGIEPIVTNTMMTTVQVAADLAKTALTGASDHET